VECVYAQGVWLMGRDWSAGHVHVLARGAELEDWWMNSLKNLPKDERRTVAALLIYTACNIWKKRN